MTIISMLGFSLIGFLDDFLKIKGQHNEGLKPYQKIIGQLGLAIILSFFVYNFVGTEVVLPFADTTLDIGIFIIPLTIITTLALTNAVNLLDGLDGLCSGVSIFYLLFFALILGLGVSTLPANLALEHQNLISVCFCLIGALTAFEIFNGFPAKVFMGCEAAPLSPEPLPMRSRVLRISVSECSWRQRRPPDCPSLQRS